MMRDRNPNKRERAVRVWESGKSPETAAAKMPERSGENPLKQSASAQCDRDQKLMEDANDAWVKAEEAKKKRLEESISRDVERVTNPEIKDYAKKSALARLDSLEKSLLGKMLFKKALADKGIDEHTWVEMVELCVEAGRGESLEINPVTGEATPITVDSRLALDNRKLAMEKIESVNDVNKSGDAPQPIVNIVIGEPFTNVRIPRVSGCDLETVPVADKSN